MTAMNEAGRVETLVGTRDGLYLLESDCARQNWRQRGPFLAGQDVTHVIHDEQRGGYWASANDPEAGPRVYRSTCGEKWTAAGDVLPGERAWHIRTGRGGELYAGLMPAALYRSDDEGQHWSPVPGLNDHPSRVEWFPGGAGLCLHTVLTPANAPGRLYVAISAAGFFRSDDDGATWRPVNEGTVSFADEIAAETGVPVQHPGVYRCVHKVVAHPHDPDVLFMQQHVGVYCSRDGGDSWQAIDAGLPSRFGFGIAAAPDPGPAGARVWVIPQDETTLRTKDQLAVWRTVDAGQTWERGTDGLPSGAHNVLREAMATDDLATPGVYFGSTTGALYASTDGGERWQTLAEGLGRVQSVEVGLVGRVAGGRTSDGFARAAR